MSYLNHCEPASILSGRHSISAAQHSRMAEYAAIVPVVDHAQKSRSVSRMRAVSAAFGLAMLATVALLATTGRSFPRDALRQYNLRNPNLIVRIPLRQAGGEKRSVMVVHSQSAEYGKLYPTLATVPATGCSFSKSCACCCVDVGFSRH